MGFYDRLESISDWIDWKIERIKFDLMTPYGFINWLPGKKCKRLSVILSDVDFYYKDIYFYEYRMHEDVYKSCSKAAYEKAVEMFNNEKYWWMSKVKQ